jgi:hypothetical protein
VLADPYATWRLCPLMEDTTVPLIVTPVAPSLQMVAVGVAASNVPLTTYVGAGRQR